MNKIYLSGNYVIVEKDGNVYEYPRTLSVYTLENSSYIIKERIDDGQFVIPISQIGTYFDEAGAVAYTEATLVTFLRENTGFKTAGGGSPATEFIISVKTDNPGTSATDQFTIPVYTLNVTNNYDVDWGDGNTDTGVSTSITHTYASAGTYTIKISGLHYIYFANGGDKLKLLEIQNWGDRGGSLWGGLRNDFYGCSNMEITATDSLILTGTNSSTQSAFQDCNNMVGNASMNTWDVLAVSDWVNTFRNCTNFNSPIGNWNMSGATNLQSMFQFCTNFNQDISSWNVQNVTNFFATLANCTNFNQDISSWNVQNVTTFQAMVAFSSSFDQNLGAWNLRIAGTNLNQIFLQSGMSIANYTDTIVSWANYVFVNGGPLNTNMSNQTGMTFDTSRSGGANFTTAGDARTYLTTATPTGAGWTISGDTVI